MRKKLIEVITVLMCVSFCMTACGNAGQQSESVISNVTIDKQTAQKEQLDEVGVTLYLPEEFTESKGVVSISGNGSAAGDGIFFVSATYIGVAKEWLDNLSNSENPSEEDIKKYTDSKVGLFNVVGIDKGRGAQEIVDAVNALMGEDAVNTGELTEIKKNGDITYYRVNKIFADNTDSLESEFAEEYTKLFGMVDAVIDNAEFFEPVGVYDELMGKAVSFETKDLDGNIVTSEELFSKYDVTMVNVWATWCQWCIKELPELEKMNNELSAKNCAIIGFLGDGEDEETIALAKEQLKEAGCTYLCLLPFEGWEEVFAIASGWPTSFFYNSKGEMVAEPVIGASLDQYKDRFDSILSGNVSDETITQNAVQNNGNAYRIYVVDQNANPVVDAKVQFCTADTCKIGTTDENGVAIFDDPEGVYQVHVLKAPEGYEVDDTILATPDKYSDITIVLQAK